MTTCSCPKPEAKVFFCPHHQRKMTLHLWELCRTGEKWYDSFDNQGNPNGSASTLSVERMDEGPGTELLKLLDKPIKILGFILRIKLEDCECEAYARKMNAWGVVGCRRRILEIVDRLQRQAKRVKMPFNRPAAKALVNLAIERAEAKITPQ